MATLDEPGGPGQDGGAGVDVLDRELEKLLNEEQLEDGDHERFSHYVPKNKIMESALTGKPVRALCGKKWTPGRDPRSSRSAPTARRSTSGCATPELRARSGACGRYSLTVRRSSGQSDSCQAAPSGRLVDREGVAHASHPSPNP